MNKKTILLIFILCTNAINLLAQTNQSKSASTSSWSNFLWGQNLNVYGSEKLINQEWQILDIITTIDLSSNSSVTVHHVDTIEQQKVILTTHENLTQYFKPQVINSNFFSKKKTLSLGLHDINGSAHYNFLTYEVYINLKNIKNIKTKNNVDVIITDTIFSDTVSIELQNNSSVKMSAIVENLNISTTNNSALEVSIVKPAQSITVSSTNNSHVIFSDTVIANTIVFNATNRASIRSNIKSDTVIINAINRSKITVTGESKKIIQTNVNSPQTKITVN